MFTRTHYNRLNRLADRILRSRRFNMGRLNHSCGTPACALGHAMAEWPSLRNKNKDTFITGTKFLTGSDSRYLADEMFSIGGCGGAGNNKHTAVAYLRALATRLLNEAPR